MTCLWVFLGKMTEKILCQSYLRGFTIPSLRGWCIHYIKAQVRLPIQVWFRYPGVNNVAIIALEVSASRLTDKL